MLASLRALGLARAIVWLVAGFVVTGGLSALVLLMTIPQGPIPLNIRWKLEATETQRGRLEQELGLVDARPTEGSTWAYRLTDPSSESIRRIVEHPLVDDTEHINRIRFRPEFAFDRTRRVIFYSGIAAGIGAVAVLLWAAKRWRTTTSG